MLMSKRYILPLLEYGIVVCVCVCVCEGGGGGGGGVGVLLPQ